VRFGFFFWPYTPEYTMRMARLGEELGFDPIGIADTPGNAMDPWVAMTLAASVTSRIRLARCVTNLVTRHPAITATAAACPVSLKTSKLLREPKLIWAEAWLAAREHASSPAAATATAAIARRGSVCTADPPVSRVMCRAASCCPGHISSVRRDT
jgi:hypothetical protein